MVVGGKIADVESESQGLKCYCSQCAEIINLKKNIKTRRSILGSDWYDSDFYALSAL